MSRLPTLLREDLPLRVAVNDVIGLVAQQNPRAPKKVVEAVGRAAAALGEAVSRLPLDQQRRLAAGGRDLTPIIAAILERLDDAPDVNLKVRLPVEPHGPVEISAGTGLGEVITENDGVERILAYTKPQRLEDWAGSVAGPGELLRRFGTKRSTLHDWQKRGAVVALLKGRRKHVFPVAQFVDGRPLAGIENVLAIVDNPRAAWMWLTRANLWLDHAKPLDRLKAGRIGEVSEAAMNDFS